LLKNELKRIGPGGRANLVKTWEPHLSSLLKDFDDQNQINTQQQQQLQNIQSAGQQLLTPQQQQQSSTLASNQSVTNLSQSNLSNYSIESQQLQTQTQQHAGSHLQPTSGSTGSSVAATLHHDLSNLPPNSHRIRRKQFVAIIVLSLIGAEFGQDVNSNKNQGPYKTIPQGFSLEDHSILKRISKLYF
jgi:hypothetical protein